MFGAYYQETWRGNSMKKLFVTGLVLLVFGSSALAEEGFEGRPITNNVWQPTGYTLNKQEFMIGLGSIGFGITDNVQVGTNVLLFLFQYYNANAKISLIKTPTHALATGISVGRFDLDVIDVEASFTALSPYLAYTHNVGGNTNLHLGGQYSYFSSDSDIEDADAEETSEGTSVFGGLEYSLSHKTKFLGEGGYDITFEGFRVGGAVLFGWEKFRLKLGVSYYNPEGVDDGFTLPVIGLWWRFVG
jgi:hypothetical protein